MIDQKTKVIKVQSVASEVSVDIDLTVPRYQVRRIIRSTDTSICGALAALTKWIGRFVLP